MPKIVQIVALDNVLWGLSDAGKLYRRVIISDKPAWREESNRMFDQDQKLICA